MKRVVIIGGGPAGLTAAYELLKEQDNNYEVIILEQSNMLGGISKTIDYNGNKMDMGGHRFFSKNHEIMKWWSNILPIQGSPASDDENLSNEKNFITNGPNPEKEDNVMLIRKRISRIYYNNTFFDYPVKLNKDTLKNLGFITSIEILCSYLWSKIFKKNENSLENFYINRFGKKLYKTFFEGYTEKLWNRHPSKISPDWGAQRVKGLSLLAIFKNMLQIVNDKDRETSLIEQFWYPKYGPGQLWSLVGKKICKLGGKIYYNHTVEKIKFKNNKITSVICANKNEKVEFKADIVISSMPIKDLVNSFSKKVDKNILNIANGLPYRDFITVGLLVKKLNLKNSKQTQTNSNMINDCWIYIQDKNIKMGRIQIFNNWSPYMVKKTNQTVWLGLEYFCDENDELWSKNNNQFADFAINELEKMNFIKKDDVINFHIERVKKAYPAYFDTYKNFNQVKKYLDNIKNLYCIGRNGQHRYNNMDHSMLTAINTVIEIKNKSFNKFNIWNVNTEKNYHEEK